MRRTRCGPGGMLCHVPPSRGEKEDLRGAGGMLCHVPPSRGDQGGCPSSESVFFLFEHPPGPPQGGRRKIFVAPAAYSAMFPPQGGIKGGVRLLRASFFYLNTPPALLKGGEGRSSWRWRHTLPCSPLKRGMSRTSRTSMRPWRRILTDWASCAPTRTTKGFRGQQRHRR